MNKRMIIYMLGRLLSIEGLLLILPAIIAAIYKENVFFIYLCWAAALILAGFLISLIRVRDKTIFPKDGLVTVALGWVFLSIAGAVPFYLTKEIPKFTDALFETVSGFTTTGASILNNVEALTHASLFWRSFTHWIGGMGVIVFIIATSKLASGGGNIYLLRSESPGPEVSKLVPSSMGTAKILYMIYIVMTLSEIIALVICGLPLFDSTALSFATAGTGGFSVRNSFLADGNPAAQTVVAIFMAAFGVNFSCYYLLLIRNFKDFFKNQELRAYLLILLGSAGIIALNISSYYKSFADAFHHAFFQVSSVMTTTGFVTADFNSWPELSRMIMLILMCIGASAGSTGGGIKVVRVILLAKIGVREIQLAAKPNKITPIRYNGKVVSENTVRSVCSFFVLYMLVFVTSLLLVSIENKDIVSTASGVIATLNNIGPGLEIVGATGNYSSYSVFSKLVFTANMLLGRLELLPLLVLASPRTWKRR